MLHHFRQIVLVQADGMIVVTGIAMRLTLAEVEAPAVVRIGGGFHEIPQQADGAIEVEAACVSHADMQLAGLGYPSSATVLNTACHASSCSPERPLVPSTSSKWFICSIVESTGPSAWRMAGRGTRVHYRTEYVVAGPIA
jgi:hypothetical protein